MKKSLLLFAAILTVLLLALPVYAADIRLSSSCSLANAIIAANRNRPEGGCPAGRGADTITLTQDITLRDELPKITSDITIEGNGYAISGDNRWRIFYNDGGALTIHDLTLIKGRAEGEIILNRKTKTDGAFKVTAAQPFGGAIINLGQLSVVNSSFSGNSALRGGAVYNASELSISDSAFSNNSANSLGGAIFNWKDGELSIVNSAFSNNSANSLGGGAIYNRGELSIVNSTFSHNSNEYSSGGAIINDGELGISDSNFSGNSAATFGGAIANHGELSIIDSSFSDNSARSGGAIINGGELSVSNSTFIGNSANDGGAVYNVNELSMVNSIIAGDSGDTCYSKVELKRNIGNFIQDGSCSPAWRGDPMLGKLVELEDGSPAYFPLLAGSRAIDAADDSYCPATDQIGAVRPQGGGCDIGAIEYAAP